jgi:nitrate/nitrite-specific signal transduction histidine kinase
MGLRGQILIWSFIPTITILTAVTLITFSAYQNVTEDLVMARDQELTRLSASQISGEISSYTDLLSEIASNSGIRSSQVAVQQRALPQFGNRLVVFDGGVVILDTFGKLVASIPERSDDQGEFWSDRDYYLKIIQTSQPAISNIVPDGPEGAEVVVIAVPILGDQGELIGTLAGMFRMGATSVSAFYGGIVKQRLGERGTNYIVDGNGRVIYHENAEIIGQDYSGKDVVQRVMRGESGATRNINGDGADTIAGFASIPGTNWGLINEERLVTLANSVQGYRNFLVALLIMGMVVPIFVVAFGIDRIMKPIEDLTVAAKGVAQGNFNQSIRAKSGDEIEELAKQFNLMAKQLQESYSQLEQRVEDRTKELTALYRADEDLLSHLELQDVLQALVDAAVELLNADKSLLLIWDAKQDHLKVGAARGFKAETLANLTFRPGEGMAGRVMQTGEAVGVEDVDKEANVMRWVTDAEGIRSFMHFPIKIGGQIFGVFNVDYVEPRAFGEEERRLFMALAQRAALAIENAQLYEQAQLAATIEERQRLARELHDAVTQSLFSSSLIAEVLPRIYERNPEEGRRRIEELRQLTRGSLAEMRTLLMELRPIALEEAEMGDLLRQLSQAFIGRARVPVDLAIEGEFEMPQEVKIALYRIVQEGLNNIFKHAGASTVDLRLDCQPDRVELLIEDDGRGFDPEDVPSDHLGLEIMHERAKEIGAQLEIKSKIGSGTQVEVVWKSGRSIEVEKQVISEHKSG